MYLGTRFCVSPINGQIFSCNVVELLKARASNPVDGYKGKVLFVPKDLVLGLSLV